MIEKVTMDNYKPLKCQTSFESSLIRSTQKPSQRSRKDILFLASSVTLTTIQTARVYFVNDFFQFSSYFIFSYPSSIYLWTKLLFHDIGRILKMNLSSQNDQLNWMTLTYYRGGHHPQCLVCKFLHHLGSHLPITECTLLQVCRSGHQSITSFERIKIVVRS